MAKNALNKCRNCGSLALCVYARFTSLTWFNFIKYHINLLGFLTMRVCACVRVHASWMRSSTKEQCMSVHRTCFNLQAVLKIIDVSIYNLNGMLDCRFSIHCVDFCNDSTNGILFNECRQSVANVKRHMFFSFLLLRSIRKSQFLRAWCWNPCYNKKLNFKLNMFGWIKWGAELHWVGLSWAEPLCDSYLSSIYTTNEAFCLNNSTWWWNE